MIHVLSHLALLAVGFGLGRIKSKAKLAVVSAEVTKVETAVKADVATAVADVKKL